MRRRRALALLAGASILTSAGCGAEYDQEHNHNTPTGPYESPPNSIIEFPYKFDNIARVCTAGGDGVYVGFNGNSTFVLAHDPDCP